MPLTKLKLKTTSQQASQRLDDTLSVWLTERLQRPVSKAKARKLVMAGAVLVDGRRVRIASEMLLSGVTIETGIDISKLFGDSASRDRPFELTTERILFEDPDLIVVDKPPGLPAHPTADRARDNLFAAVTRFLAGRDAAAKPYVGIHHRLDRDTSGVVLFTKSKRANAAAAEIFSNHTGTKIYQALTIAAPSPKRRGDVKRVKREWTIKNFLGRIASHSKRAKYGAVRSEGDIAETSFCVFGTYPGGMLIEAIPTTGRTHQIRVHLSEYGLPILGDDLYGPAGSQGNGDILAPRLMLHAAQLIFPHPITGHEISVRSPLPGDFQRCLDRIKTRERYKLER